MDLSHSERRELERRKAQAVKGQRDPQRDYSEALQRLRKAHAAFKASSDKHGHHSAPATEAYARASRDLEFCELVVLGFCEIRRIA